MSQVPEVLFRPYEHKSLKLRNRVAMAPMTRNFSPDGVLTDAVVDYYRRRAENEVGLIITEGTTIDHPVANPGPDVPRFHGESSLAAWKKVVDAVHEAGGAIIPQLWHVGMMRREATPPYPDELSCGPSGLVRPGKKKGREMSQADIDQVVQGFAKAAAEAERLGFDGVELHGAHGYLIDQFFWEGTNERTDAYGGSMQERGRFALEVIEAVRAAVDPGFAVVFRYSQWKSQDYEARLATTPDELERFLTPLSQAGVDLFHCSTRRFWETEFEGSDLNLAGWTGKLTGKPTMTVGSVGLDGEFFGAFAGQGSKSVGLDKLVKRMSNDEFDLVAVGRALLQDPEWLRKIHEGRMEELQDYDGAALGTLS